MTTNGKPGTGLALLASRLQVTEAEVQESLTQTVFKGATPAQMTALLVVANEYGLNPFTRELFAFPSKNGIVPVVSVDGWLRIINEHPQFAGMDIVYAETIVEVKGSRPCPEYIEVTIHRKDRPGTSTPIREYLDECYRATEPWNTMTRRMLRHKAIKEAARVTMGLHGIFDVDEAADVLAHEGKRIVADDDVYDLVEIEEDAGEVIGSAEYDALLAEVERTRISLQTIAKNVAAKAGYTGALEDMPMPVWESLMSGLAQMPSKGAAEQSTSAAQEPRDGAGSPQGDPEAAEALPGEESAIRGADPEPPGMDAEAYRKSRGNVTPLNPDGPATPQQLAEIKKLRKAVGINAADFATLVSEFGGEPTEDGYGLTQQQAEFVIEALTERSGAR
jgi:phage recombination protein Bet